MNKNSSGHPSFHEDAALRGDRGCERGLKADVNWIETFNEIPSFTFIELLLLGRLHAKEDK